MKKICKYVCLFLVLLMILSGCQKKPTIKQQPDYYQDKLVNYLPREKTTNTDKNEEFDKFLYDVFLETLKISYFDIKYTIADSDIYTCKKEDLNLGDITYGFDNEGYIKNEEYLDKLYSFDYSTLSKSQQYDYEVLEYSIFETLAMAPFNKYELLFNSRNDMVNNVITTFSDFTFHNAQECDEYLIVLEDFDRYIDDCIKYTESQQKDGIFYTDYSLDGAIEYIDGLTAARDNFVLINEFDNRINELSFLDNAKKKELKDKNKEIIEKEVIPSLEKLSSYLGQLYGKSKGGLDAAVYNIDPDYAEYLYYIDGSDNSNIDEIFDKLVEVYDILCNDVYVAANKDDVWEKYEELYQNGDEVLNQSEEEIIDWFLKNYTKYYPKTDDIKYRFSVMDKIAADENALAYYWTAPVVDDSQNIIRINPNYMGNEEDGAKIQMFSTLSHEGVPGHMYQTVYFQRTNPSYLRANIFFLGYTEGWAVYGQENAFKMYTDDIDLVNILKYDSIEYFLAYSIMDLGINYYGWDEDYLKEVMEILGYDPSYSAELIDFFTDNYGVYLHYGVGYTNFELLKEKAINELGDKYSDVEFNEALLENGSVPFVILEDAVNTYIEKEGQR